MTRYTATIQHHTISRAPVIDVGDDLTAAKRRATREFGDGFSDHTIVIMDDRYPMDPVVARKVIGSRGWTAA